MERLRDFEPLVASVQVGSQRLAPPRSPLLDAWQDPQTERRTWVTLGAMGLMQQAGKTPTPAINPLPAAPPETLPVAHAALEPLQEAFDLGQWPVVREWVELAAQRGRIVPVALLPEFLKKAPKPNPATLAVMGERGRWLVQVLGIPVEDRGQDGRLDRAELKEQWGTLDWKARVRSLEQMAADLSDEDEDFLASVAKDSKKEVREAIAWLRVRIKSALRDQVEALAFRCVKLVHGVIRLEPPDLEECPKDICASHASPKMGPRMTALCDLIAAIDPVRWCLQFGANPAQWVVTASKNEDGAVMVRGWMRATTRWRHREWALALLDWVDRHPKESLDTASGILDRAVVNAFLVTHPESRLMLPMVRREWVSLDLPASRVVVAALKRVQQGGIPRTMVKQLAICLHPGVLPDMQSPWHPAVEDLRIEILPTLALRQRLLDSLQP